MLVADGILDVQEASDTASKRQLFGDGPNLVNNLFREREGRPAASGVARVNTTLLDVLQNGTYVAFLGVTERVNIQLNGVLKEGIQVDGTVWCDVCSGLHVGDQVGIVVDNGHAATTKNVAWANNQWVTNATSGVASLVHGRSNCRRWAGDVQAVKKGCEAVTVLCQVNCLWLSAHDRNASVLKSASKLDWSLATKGNNDAFWLLNLNDIHDVFKGQRLEIQTVRGVVVRRDGLWVAVDHDGLIALLAKSVGSMYAAVVKLNALANTVRTCRENHNAWLFCLNVLCGIALLVRDVVVLRGCAKLTSTGIYRLDLWANTQHFPYSADNVCLSAGKVCKLLIREAQLLGSKHVIGGETRKSQLLDAFLGVDDACHTVQIPRIDASHIVDALNAPVSAQSLSNVENTLWRWLADQLVKVLLVKDIVAVSAQTSAILLQGTKCLLQSFLKGSAHSHSLADRLHTGGQNAAGALELDKGKTRNLDHTVVDRRLKGSRSCLGDVVGNLVKRVTNRKERSHLCNGESGCLGSKRGRTTDARIHLNDNDAAVSWVDRKLNVRAAAGNTYTLENSDGVVAEVLELFIGKRLSWSNGNGVSCVDAHWIEVLDGADNNTVTCGIAHDLHLNFFPALNGLLYQYLVLWRKQEALLNNLYELFWGVRNAAARTAKGEAWTDDHRVSQLGNDTLGVFHGVSDVCTSNLQANVLDCLAKELAVLTGTNGLQVATDDLDVVLVKNACLAKADGAVQSSLATHVWQKGIRTLALNDAGYGLNSDWLNVGSICSFWVSHDGCWV